MQDWWVNQNQTYRHEIAGGYLWSPHSQANDARHQYHVCMREVSVSEAVPLLESAQASRVRQRQGELGQHSLQSESRLRQQAGPNDYLEILWSLPPTPYFLLTAYRQKQPDCLPERDFLAIRRFLGFHHAEAAPLLHSAAVVGLLTNVQSSYSTYDDLDYRVHRLKPAVVQEQSTPRPTATLSPAPSVAKRCSRSECWHFTESQQESTWQVVQRNLAVS